MVDIVRTYKRTKNINFFTKRQLINLVNLPRERSCVFMNDYKS